jgi:hypothetical protein
MFGSVLTNGGGNAVYHAPFPGYTPQLLARTGMPAAVFPGTPAVSNLHVHSASREGHVLVSGVITGAPINNDVALWTWT